MVPVEVDTTKRPGAWRRLAVNLLVALTATLLGALAIEGALRLGVAWQKRNTPPARTLSEHLGWATAPYVQRVYTPKGYQRVHYATGAHGFRVYGDPESDRFKLFAIGDSITAGGVVSNGGLYYDFLGQQRADLEIFAYGAGGYGTLQEAMVLERWVDTIGPDLIVWQLSGNDIINNLHALETRSRTNNNHMRRPYLEGGRVVWRLPSPYYGALHHLVQSSYLLRLVDIRASIFAAERLGSIEAELVAGHPLLEASVAATGAILSMIAARAGDIPVVAFLADPSSWRDRYPALCAERGIAFVPDVPNAIVAAIAAGEVVDGRPHDAHWNQRGHAIAGRLLLDFLAAGGYLERRTPPPRPGPPIPQLRFTSTLAGEVFGGLDLARLDSASLSGLGPSEGPFPEHGLPAPFRWMIEPRAEIPFRVAEPPALPMVLRLAVRSHVAGQRLRIFLDDTRLGALPLARNRTRVWRSPLLDLPPGAHVLRLEADRYYTPPPGTRRLYVIVERLTVGAAE